MVASGWSPITSLLSPISPELERLVFQHRSHLHKWLDCLGAAEDNCGSRWSQNCGSDDDIVMPHIRDNDGIACATVRHRIPQIYFQLFQIFHNDHQESGNQNTLRNSLSGR